MVLPVNHQERRVFENQAGQNKKRIVYKFEEFRLRWLSLFHSCPWLPAWLLFLSWLRTFMRFFQSWRRLVAGMEVANVTIGCKLFLRISWDLAGPRINDWREKSRRHLGSFEGPGTLAAEWRTIRCSVCLRLLMIAHWTIVWWGNPRPYENNLQNPQEEQ